MTAIFVLDIPEFEPIVATARAAGMRIRRVGDYVEASSSEPEVSLLRRHTGVRPAIWFAALTGGLVGRIIRFEHDELRICEAL